MKLTMTEELLRYNHYNLWNWLAKTGLTKDDAPMMKTLDKYRHLSDEYSPLEEAIGTRCFACGACSSECQECPISWSDRTRGTWSACLYAPDSLFKKWSHVKTVALRKKYAAEIAKLPWRGKKP